MQGTFPLARWGEIVGRGADHDVGLLQAPELTSETIREGWVYTGDLGYVDEDGFLHLVDRKKDLIISGVNVYPRDIEEVVVQHEAVADAAVFGVADEHWGETPVAAVTLRAGGGERRKTKRWVNERVEARYQKLAAVLVLDRFRGVAGDASPGDQEGVPAKKRRGLVSDRFAETNGIRLHYLDHGGPEPTLVLAPGLHGQCSPSTASSRPASPVFAYVIALDLRAVAARATSLHLGNTTEITPATSSGLLDTPGSSAS